MNPVLSPLVIRDLRVGYKGRTVLDSFSLPPLVPGELVALVGPNAAGKSTLLRALANLVKSQGDVTLGDRALARMAAGERARRIGFMPQSLPEGIGLTVVEGVIAALHAARVESDDGQDMAGLAFATLARLGIGDLAMRRLSQLSGGQRQLASLAQAMAGRPPVLLLDEPTSALDPARQFQILRLIRDYAHGANIVMVVLHDLVAAARWADRIAVLHDGGLYAFGSPREVVTPQMLANVYNLVARVEESGSGQLSIEIDDCIISPALPG